MENDVQNKRELLRKYYQQIKTGFRFELAGYINTARLSNAKKRFAADLDVGSVIGFYDTSLNCDGSNGYLFTDTKVYYLETGGKPQIINYDEIKNVELISKGKKDYDNELKFELVDGTEKIWKSIFLNKTPLFEFFNALLKMNNIDKIADKTKTVNLKESKVVQHESINEKPERQLRQKECRDNIETSKLTYSQIITYNPIMKDSHSNKNLYLKCLESYLEEIKRSDYKYENAMLAAYRKLLMESKSGEEKHDFSYYKYYILLDLIHILAYEFVNMDISSKDLIKKRYYSNFGSGVETATVERIFKNVTNKENYLDGLLKDPALEKEKKYIEYMYENVSFQEKVPVELMITATMSAGKSTFINALTGKYVCLSQNMACTSKVHRIVNKAYEDGLSYEHDYDLVLTAGREELLNDNEKNQSDEIVVGTKFIGELSNQRIIVSDSPGVNYSGNQEHKAISDSMIKSQKYDALIYIMNATQLGTDDESAHLEYVRKAIGTKKILFIVNKIDTYNPEEEDIMSTLQNIRGMLEKKNFKDPIICPVSARAGYLAKQFQTNKLTKLEERELYNYVDKFDRMCLVDYYTKEFDNIKIKDSEKEEIQLLKTCGMAYVERIIKAMCNDEMEGNEKMIKPILPIYVLATMSSGKSTLINALLRKNLMPSRNAACTAITTEVLNDNREGYQAVAYDEKGNAIQKIPDLTMEIASELNEDERIACLRAEGKIPFFNAKNIELELIDTMGSLNSKNERLNSIYQAINRDSKNMILYVLNGTQLAINNDAAVLYYIAKQMERANKQERKRFLFVVNKMDALDPEKEDIENVIISVKKYLAQFGIEEPQIFPCSAYAALHIRTELANVAIDCLTRTEERRLSVAARDTLGIIDKVIEYDSMHLEQYSILSPSAQQNLEFRLSEAIQTGNTKEQALIHSGICSIEAAINEYAESVR